jgi:cell division control protein 24
MATIASSRMNNNGGLPGSFSPPPLERSQTFSTFDSARESSENIVNRKGGVNSSLYQSCLALRRRLAEVPGFDEFLLEMEEEERESDDTADPVTSMWNLLRRGFPLMSIFNALEPKVPLEVNSATVAESKQGKAASYKFMQACIEELGFPIQECFLVSDLYGQDTTGFVKVWFSSPWSSLSALGLSRESELVRGRCWMGVG